MLRKAIIMLVAVSMLFTGCTKDEDAKDEFTLGTKSGILLVTFGSSFPDPQATFKKIDAAARAKYPNEEIRWGYTSDIILNKLRQGNGEGSLNGTIIDNDTPQEAIEKMVKDGYSTITVQSLHVIPGDEYDDLKDIVNEKVKEYSGLKCVVGKPLLDSPQDLKDVAKILVNIFDAEKQSGKPVLFMGHGTPHHANHSRYKELEAEVQKLAPNFFIGTVEKAPMISEVLTEVNALNLKDKKVIITPLMSIAGDHANNDMNGVTGETNIDDQSWKERLLGEGYKPTSIMKGLGDYPEIVKIWINHLEAVKLDK